MSKRRVALVTGGTRGIGLGIAKRLAGDPTSSREQFDLVVCGVRAADQVGDSIDAIKQHGVDALYCQCDIAATEDRQKMIAEIESHFGRLDVLVNNAGVAPKRRLDIMEATEEDFEWVLKTNLQGPYFLTQQVANWFVKQAESDLDDASAPPRSIINVSSISATVASPSRGEYCISKAGVSMATSLWAVRLAEYGIPVFEVRPGITATDMTSAVKEKYDRLIDEGLIPQARWGQPEDTGKIVAAMACGDFGYSTGQVVMVDGGMTIPRL